MQENEDCSIVFWTGQWHFPKTKPIYGKLADVWDFVPSAVNA